MPHHLCKENLYQMVLHRPIETTAVTGKVPREPGLVFLTGLRATRKTYSYLSS